MPLTNIQCAAAGPGKYADGRGMYLYVTQLKDGRLGKYWRFKYRWQGREKLLALGVYPDVSLKDARERREDARRLLSQGIDPSATKKAEKISVAGADTFEAIAIEWHQRFNHTWTPSHAASIMARLKQNVFPWLGKHQVKSITPPMLLDVLRRVEGRGALVIAHRLRSTCGQIFRYAIATGRLERDPAHDLRGALTPAKTKHFATITDPTMVGKLMQDIYGYQGSYPVQCALKLAPMLMVRPGELRHAEWSEIDFAAGVWRIPAAKMKRRLPHVIPLSTQALELLNLLKPLTGEAKSSRYLFPSIRSNARPMSNNTVNSALRRLGYSADDIVGHGFRRMASTLLNEQGWNRDAIERQLAHKEPNKSRATYNAAEYLPERTRMMQGWADYLDRLRESSSSPDLANQ